MRCSGGTAWPRCPRTGDSVVTVGFFDGVHHGHRRVVRRAVELARARGAKAVVLTFDPHPSEVVRPGTHPPLLTTPTHRADLMGELGVDAVLVLPFTVDLSRLTPAEFAKQVLVERLHAVAVVVGENFRFGHKAAGTVAVLTELGAEYGFAVEGLALAVPEEGEGSRFSSTDVRRMVLAGDVETAALRLDRPHRVEGMVVHGAKRGRELGFPTANVDTPAHTAIPADGVYAGWLVVGGERLPAAVSVGTNPQFDGEQPHRRGVRAGPHRSRPLRQARRGRLRGTGARAGEVLRHRRAHRNDQPGRGQGQGSALRVARYRLVRYRDRPTGEQRPPADRRVGPGREDRLAMAESYDVLLKSTESWFVRRGLPYFIEDRKVTEDVFTRALPMLLVYFVGNLMVVLSLHLSTLQRVGGAVLGVLLLALVYMLRNRFRGEKVLGRPSQIGWFELGGFIVIPPIVAFVARHKVKDALIDLVVDICVVVVIYVIASALFPLARWAFRRTFQELGEVFDLAARALPLVFLFNSFLFISGDVWEFAGGESRPRLWGVVGMFTLFQRSCS